jgi:hypothetical protein
LIRIKASAVDVSYAYVMPDFEAQRSCSRCGRPTRLRSTFIDPLAKQRMRLFECPRCGKLDTAIFASASPSDPSDRA